ncbi:hemerythrin domain-containing protein [Jannaschia sp. W003]|uniref:hemerythrin domain-containing protein n=1 Tax=Jannaschia sp. W003 TaxID=2867012 RepID=UPI0021A4E61A|nr:hemerythrin domain-containing protein [Jannaschia sp. W003]UWQ21810.1 hemerythrin domain-containing protein [Jannaschia sp. W003]
MRGAPDPLALERRAGLPDTLRALVEEIPRETWEAHPEFGALTRFWLERHLRFRRMLAMLGSDLAEREAGRLAPEVHASRLARVGSLFLQELHGHHSVEDEVYFPKLAAHAPTLERGFALLDADHHRLHEELERFAADANVLLGGGEAGPMADTVRRMEGFLDRHLTDEEELVVPVILRVGEARL